MRKRLVLAFVGLTVLVVVLYGVPRAYLRIEQVRDREQEQVDQSAVLLAALAAADRTGDQEVTEEALSALLRPGEHVEYAVGDSVVSAGDPAAVQETGVEATAPVDGGGTMTLSYSQDALDERVREAVLPLLLIGLLLVAFAWLAALALARRLARPIQELGRHARQLGAGHFDLDVPHYAMAEVEEVGQALRASAHDLDLLVRRERDFAANASHELRTPITAARLRVEDLSLWDGVPPEVHDELAEILVELGRLDTAVTTLLERDRGDRTAAAAEVDLSALITTVASSWGPRLAEAGRGLAVDAPPGLRVRLDERPVVDVLDLLLGEALAHGRGDVRLSARDTSSYLEVAVADQRPRTHGSEVLHAADKDAPLPRAAELAAAVGGHLTVGPGPDTSFVLRLPATTARPD